MDSENGASCVSLNNPWFIRRDFTVFVNFSAFYKLHYILTVKAHLKGITFFHAYTLSISEVHA